MYSHDQLKRFVERAIKNLSFSTEADRLMDPVKYVLSIGGKRLRPVLALMSCNLFTDKVDEAVLPAAGIEVFHNFTLVHDDIMDKAPLRRSLPTVHSKWNINQAVLSGDVMAFIANDCFLQAPVSCLPKVFRIFNRAAIEVCIGQQLDMDFEKSSTVTHDEYLRMIELKTAVLIAASSKIGAVIGGAKDKESEAMYQFGLNLGLAFQLQDDLLDIFGDSRVFGKQQGGDIMANKKTFLYVRAMELASPAQQSLLHDLYTSKDLKPEEKVKRVMELYNKLNIRNETGIIVKEYVDKAFRLLDKVEVAADRKAEITELAGQLIGREK
jgi:geranylgeranyl diphosphate synthase, type II